MLSQDLPQPARDIPISEHQGQANARETGPAGSIGDVYGPPPRPKLVEVDFFPTPSTQGMQRSRAAPELLDPRPRLGTIPAGLPACLGPAIAYTV